MRIYSPAAWALSGTIISSAAAQEFRFDGPSFATDDVFGASAASIFQFDDIREGKNFTLTQIGGTAEVTRLDLMDAGPHGEGSTLASWCLDKSENCTSTAGFSLSKANDTAHNIILGSEVMEKLAEYFGAVLYFRVDWQLNGGAEKRSSWSQTWSIAGDQEQVTSIYHSYTSMTAGAWALSTDAAAPTTVPYVLFNTASPVTISPSSNTSIGEGVRSTGSVSQGLATGAIVGIVVGCVGGLILVGLVAGCFCLRRRQQDADRDRGSSRGVQDAIAEKEARASIAGRDQPDTPYSEQNSQQPLRRGLASVRGDGSSADLGIGQAISGERGANVDDGNAGAYSSLGGAAVHSGHGTPVMGSGACASGRSSPLIQPHTPSVSAHDRGSVAMGSPIPRSSSQLDRPLSPYRDDADAVRQGHSGDDTARAPSSLYSSNPLDEAQPTPGSGTGAAGRAGGASSRKQGHSRASTPSGIAQQYAHLVEDGMTDDEIRRLEEEERALDEAIAAEQAGEAGRQG